MASPRPRKILYIDNSFTFGGAINSLCHLFRAIDKNRFTPVLITGQPRQFLEGNFSDCIWYRFLFKLPWVDDRQYRRLIALPLFRNRYLLKVINLLRFLYWIAFVSFPEATKICRLAAKHGVEIVHLNNIFSTQLNGIIAAKLLGLPCIAHLRGFVEIHPITRLCARLVDHHVVISAAIKDNLAQLGVPDEKITVVHDGIDLKDFRILSNNTRLEKEFDIAPGQHTFGIFGRVVEWKGIREFILAARHVADEIPGARGFVVGSPSDGSEAFLRQMQQLAADLGLAGKVIFTGYRGDVAELMGLMDVIVHASIEPEPFGMVLIEGMAMEKPVVATRGGGPLDIVIDGQTGSLVEMGNAVVLGQAIITLLRQPELRRKMGAEGRARVEKFFSNCRYAEQIGLVYQNIKANG